MKKEFKVNGKVTYPQGAASRTTYTLIDDVGNMINLNADTDTDFDYGDAVVMTITKKNAQISTTVDPVTGSVTTGNTTTTAPTDTATDTASTDTAKSDATTATDTATTDAQAASSTATETEAK